MPFGYPHTKNHREQKGIIITATIIQMAGGGIGSVSGTQSCVLKLLYPLA